MILFAFNFITKIQFFFMRNRFGFAHIPTQPGFHRFNVRTWKLAPQTIVETLHSRFNTAGLTVAKSDLIFSGSERYKISTQSSGKVAIECMLIAKNFDKFGVKFG